MKYTIVIEKLAEKCIVELPKPEKERVLKAIYQLPEGNDIRELKDDIGGLRSVSDCDTINSRAYPHSCLPPSAVGSGIVAEQGKNPTNGEVPP